MINLERNLGRFGLVAIRSAALAAAILAQTTIQAPSAYASNEMTTRPWSAPVGHRQPHAADLPASVSASQQIIDQEDANIDRKIRGICRGC
ncbi:hypothetical protein [Bradyrhizobium sp. LTSP885]|uniref:hypothetical protein n=1 Tax=Bradyrhizobium sp. LTSP885 TaxID=1619232 RepID=UPI001FD8AA51|nr:hypothetical protein [Bradyrhizobium sp. LTSP885]